MRDIVAKFGKLVEDDIGWVAPELGTFIIDFLDIALRARGLDDAIGLENPGAEPLETLFAHALRQHGDAAAIDDARDRDPAAAVIPCRRPNCLVTGRIEPAGHQSGYQTAIGCQHLVRPDHRETAAERHDDRRAHSGQRRREDQIAGGPSKTPARPVVVPMHAEEIGRVRTIRIDGPKRTRACFGNAAGVGQLGESRQLRSRPTQPSRRAVANNAVDERRHDSAMRHRSTVSHEDAVPTHPTLEAWGVRP